MPGTPDLRDLTDAVLALTDCDRRVLKDVLADGARAAGKPFVVTDVYPLPHPSTWKTYLPVSHMHDALTDGRFERRGLLECVTFDDNSQRRIYRATHNAVWAAFAAGLMDETH